MAIKEISKSYIFICDGCRKEHRQEHLRRPSHWMKFILERNALDYQGHAVADGTIKRLLCDVCGEKIGEAINKVVSL